MPSPIKLEDHLTADELYQRYRKCQQPREKLRWRALYLIAKGGIANHVAKQVGRSSGWITNLARRYNELGLEGVADQRGEVSCGVKPTLSAKQAQALDAAPSGVCLPLAGGGGGTRKRAIERRLARCCLDFRWFDNRSPSSHPRWSLRVSRPSRQRRNPSHHFRR